MHEISFFLPGKMATLKAPPPTVKEMEPWVYYRVPEQDKKRLVQSFTRTLDIWIFGTTV